MEQWWNVTDRGKMKYREKSIKQCRWYGWMSVEQWWNGTDRGILKCWEINILQRGWQMDG